MDALEILDQVYRFLPRCLLTPPTDRRSCFGLHLAISLGRALVVKLLSFADSEFHLDESILQVEFRRNHGEALLARRFLQFADLGAMEQELAAAHRLVVHDVAMRILPDVGVHQPGFVARYLAERILQLDLAVASGLHLGSTQDQPRLHSVREEIEMSGLPIVTEDFDAGRFHSTLLTRIPSIISDGVRRQCSTALRKNRLNQ